MVFSFPAPPPEQKYYTYEKNEPVALEQPRVLKFTPLFKPRPDSVPITDNGAPAAVAANPAATAELEEAPPETAPPAVTTIRPITNGGIKVRQIKRRPETPAMETEPTATTDYGITGTAAPDIAEVTFSSGPVRSRRRPRRRVHLVRRGR